MTPETPQSKRDERVKHSRCLKVQTGREKLETFGLEATKVLKAEDLTSTGRRVEPFYQSELTACSFLWTHSWSDTDQKKKKKKKKVVLIPLTVFSSVLENKKLFKK